jgi:hypothetical protein
MIKVTIGTSTQRLPEKIVEETMTIKEVLEEAEVVYEAAQIHIDGAIASPTDMNASFETLGITDSCRIIAVVKTNNGI